MPTALRITALDRPGLLADVARTLAAAGADIRQIAVHAGSESGQVRLHLELSEVPSGDLLGALSEVDEVASIDPSTSGYEIYGKRIIVMGGGAQVGQVALGAISEADRHNIRGERISVDTIPLVGEAELAAAVRATVQLPRVSLLVLAGSLMGGAITDAVHYVRERGIAVISLNMAGSVPEAVDLVVTDPVQAGVMAVMAVADTASFDLLRQERRGF